MRKRKLFITVIMCMVMIFLTATTANTIHARAKATKEALTYLKGTWHTGSMPGYKVKLTEKYVKYYVDYDSNFNQLPSEELGKLECKYKIVFTKKKKGKWIIKVKAGKNGYYYFKEAADDKETLEYWENLKDSNSYSGSSSLGKQHTQN